MRGFALVGVPITHIISRAHGKSGMDGRKERKSLLSLDRYLRSDFKSNHINDLAC